MLNTEVKPKHEKVTVKGSLMISEIGISISN